MAKPESIEDAYVVIKTKSGYKFLDLYVRNKEIYAKHGSNYIKLLKNNITTDPRLTWSEISGTLYSFNSRQVAVVK